jgi:hypothetical protein
MMTKGDPYRRIARRFFFVGILGLFFTLELTHPLHPRSCRKNAQYGPLGEYLDLQAPVPAIAETSDENDVYIEWNGLSGPFLEALGPGKGKLFAEPKEYRCADCGALSLPISRSPPVCVSGQ